MKHVVLSRSCVPKYIHLDIDTSLNFVIPPTPLPYLPTWLSHFLGHRSQGREPAPDVGSVLIAFWALLGTFLGLTSVAATIKYSAWIAELAPPVLIGSLGAAAILDYNTVYSPLAMPRNSIFGHTLAAFVGVCFAQLMLLSPKQPDDISWLIGPLACGAASVAMTFANSIYPPGGATALLAVADPQVRKLGWWLVLIVFLASLEMLGVALVINNCQRRYPMWWWSPLETGGVYRRMFGRREKTATDVETLRTGKGKRTGSDGSITQVEDAATVVGETSFEESIVLGANGMLSVPDWMQLDDAERVVLEGLLGKLRSPNYGRSVNEMSWTGDKEPP